MKETTLLEMKNKLDVLMRIVQQCLNEQHHLTTLATGTLETLKLMPGYDDALKALTEKAKEEFEQKEKELPKPLLN